MFCKKHHVLAEREMILKSRVIGCSIAEIGQRLGRNEATVSMKMRATVSMANTFPQLQRSYFKNAV
jgi:IS30 family transposase